MVWCPLLQARKHGLRWAQEATTHRGGNKLRNAGARRVEPAGLHLGSLRLTSCNSLTIGNRDGIAWVGGIAERCARATRRLDGDTSCGGQEFAHELVAAMGAEVLVGPVGFVADFDAEFQALHIAEADEFDVEVGLEVSAVVVGGDEFLHLGAEGEDVFHLGGGGDVDMETLLHLSATANVLDPEVVSDVVWDLNDAIVVDSLEDGVHQANVLDDQLLVVDGDSVTDVVWVLDEEEDTAGEKLGNGTANGKCETSERSPELSRLGSEGFAEEGGVDEGDGCV